MRVVMIHALAESIPPVRLAFMEEFPEAEVVNLLDEGLLVDFPGSITPSLRRRMSGLICYCQDNNADAIGLACSVYAPVVDSARDLVEVPLVSSYGPVMAEAVAAGPRVGVIATNEATMSDSEYYLEKAAREAGKNIQVKKQLATDLIQVLRENGHEAFEKRLETGDPRAFTGGRRRAVEPVLLRHSTGPSAKGLARSRTLGTPQQCPHA